MAHPDRIDPGLYANMILRELHHGRPADPADSAERERIQDAARKINTGAAGDVATAATGGLNDARRIAAAPQYRDKTDTWLAWFSQRVAEKPAESA